MRGKMWRVIKEMYRVSRSTVLLDGECSEAFDVVQGAQGCSLSPILFSVFINGLLKEVEQAGLGVELSDGSIYCAPRVTVLALCVYLSVRLLPL